ncbi:monosaccharide ABC transporter ATP-binding protein (CUT2 family) [Rhizobium sp. SJZ105]|uniref:sugar ABC transporter ATP-binding protein n=1 Tax=Rhizobium sp. SJZ105 TaxID=2572678 RepID=UPI0011A37C11|nr:sugar ABC transporter ATP-binding protein [Rhizobium sp. SJZ105]TWC78861.1 monosaccharide ABC transporter ATP-binding protein (CUT2 family) [Rhizobium sp. SJZ105]
MDKQPVFQARNIEKVFPGVRALKGVNLSLEPGSIHALLGENGAGKSTLIKVITGVHHQSSGQILVDGEEVRFGNPREAIARGIGVVHQERNLIPRFSIAENIHMEKLGAHYLKPIDYAALNRDARRWLQALNLEVDPAMPVSELSVAQMQLVEIAKALSLQSRVLLLDEPTTSLTPSETDNLFRILRRLRDDGASLVFVSHKLEEVLDICDRVTVLRDGENACESRSMEGLGRQDLVRLMIGRAEGGGGWRKRAVKHNPLVLELKGVSTAIGHRDVSLSVHKGEIVGLYGLVGAGRTELAKSIMGKFAVTEGEVRIEDRPARIRSVAEAIHEYGVGYVSEDRKGDGLILQHSVLANAGVPIWRKLSNAFGVLSDSRIRAAVTPFLQKLEVKTPSLSQTVGNLSGGNQQKISVAKWLAADVKLLIVDEPSVGIDIKTKAYLHDLLRELADGGTAILVITSDMPEMVALADRIVVMDRYRVKGVVENNGVYADMSESIMGLIHDAERETALSRQA